MYVNKATEFTLSCSADAPVFAALSDPAKSTKLSWKENERQVDKRHTNR